MMTEVRSEAEVKNRAAVVGDTDCMTDSDMLASKVAGLWCAGPIHAEGTNTVGLR